MNETIKDENSSIYEIGYLIVSSVPEEKIQEEAAILSAVIKSSGGSMIAEESPKKQHLSYTMRKKTVSGSYNKYDEAYFGWFKFEMTPDKIVQVKETFEKNPSILRILLVSTVRENTYLGKRAAMVAASFADKGETADTDKVARRIPSKETAKEEPKKDTPPATIEEMDKSIEEMVKGTKI